MLLAHVRSIFALLSLYFILDHPLATVYCHGTSILLGLFQETTAKNKILLDKCSFIGLLIAIGHFYPWLMFWFQVTVILEVSTTSHGHPLLAPFLHYRSIIQFGSEVFYLLLYLRAFYDGPPLFYLPLLTVLAAAAFPFALLKFILSSLQFLLSPPLQ